MVDGLQKWCSQSASENPFVAGDFSDSSGYSYFEIKKRGTRAYNIKQFWQAQCGWSHEHKRYALCLLKEWDLPASHGPVADTRVLKRVLREASLDVYCDGYDDDDSLCAYADAFALAFGDPDHEPYDFVDADEPDDADLCKPITWDWNEVRSVAQSLVMETYMPMPEDEDENRYDEKVLAEVREVVTKGEVDAYFRVCRTSREDFAPAWPEAFIALVKRVINPEGARMVSELA